MEEQLKQVLDVTSLALKRIHASRSLASQSLVTAAQVEVDREHALAVRRKRLMKGDEVWRDVRMDSVAGLDFGGGGLGDLGMEPDDESEPLDASVPSVDDGEGKGKEAGGEVYGDVPIVVLKNYDGKGSGKREEVLNALAGWVGTLIGDGVRFLSILLLE